MSCTPSESARKRVWEMTGQSVSVQSVEVIANPPGYHFQAHGGKECHLHDLGRSRLTKSDCLL